MNAQRRPNHVKYGWIDETNRQWRQWQQCVVRTVYCASVHCDRRKVLPIHRTMSSRYPEIYRNREHSGLCMNISRRVLSSLSVIALAAPMSMHTENVKLHCSFGNSPLFCVLIVSLTVIMMSIYFRLFLVSVPSCHGINDKIGTVRGSESDIFNEWRISSNYYYNFVDIFFCVHEKVVQLTDAPYACTLYI